MILLRKMTLVTYTSIYESMTPLNSDLLGDQQGFVRLKLNLTFFPRVKKNN